MPSTPTTKSQVQAYKFVLRRMQSALVRRDAVMLHDPMRTHSRATVVGVILGVLGGVVFVLVALLSPAPSLPATDNIVIGQQSGTVYVVSGNPEKLTPTFNLASARLILMAQKKAASQGQGQGQAGQPAPATDLKVPTVVSDEQLKNIPRTKLTGIPDGPQLLPDAQQRISPNWAVCDQVELDPQLPQPDSANKTDTTVVAGVANVGAELQQGQALLGSADGKTYLIYRLSASQARPDANTVRAEVSMDPSDPAHSALQLPSHARKVSQAFLNAIPNVEKLAAPEIPGTGGSPSADFDGLTVGDVFSTTPAGQEAEFWLITQNGIQKVNPAVADIIRVARNHGDSGTIQSLGLDKTKITKQLQPTDDGYIKVDNFPAKVPTVLDATQGSPVACLGWSLSADKTNAHTSVYMGSNLPVDKNADGSSKVLPVSATGPNGLPITGFYMTPGYGAVVQSATESPATFGKGPIQLISDRGIRYGVPDTATADGLGLTDRLPAPESIIGLLPTGASLNTQNVLKQFDSVPIDPNAGAFPTPSTPPAGN